MKCVKAELKLAEKVKTKLLNLGIFSKDYDATRDNNYVYFPVTKAVKDFIIVERRLVKKKQKLSFRDLLKKSLSEKELDLISKSYDVVGNIAILEIDDELFKKKKLIAEALLKSNKNVRTVVRKVGGHEGEYRIQDYEYLAGLKKFEIVYKENSILIKLDIRKAFFSPRLSNERMRITKLIKDEERVLVMFSGVSPYELNIAKNSNAREIYGVEINKDACKYAEESVKLNSFNKINLFCGDVRKILPKLNKKFDRIVMPLPKNSKDFLDLALKYLNKKGIIHFYCFSEENKIQETIAFLKSKCKCKVLNIVKCGQKSPRISRFCVDFQVL